MVVVNGQRVEPVHLERVGHVRSLVPVVVASLRRDNTDVAGRGEAEVGASPKDRRTLQDAERHGQPRRGIRGKPDPARQQLIPDRRKPDRLPGLRGHHGPGHALRPVEIILRLHDLHEDLARTARHHEICLRFHAARPGQHRERHRTRARPTGGLQRVRCTEDLRTDRDKDKRLLLPPHRRAAHSNGERRVRRGAVQHDAAVPHPEVRRRVHHGEPTRTSGRHSRRHGLDPERRPAGPAGLHTRDIEPGGAGIHDREPVGIRAQHRPDAERRPVRRVRGLVVDDGFAVCAEHDNLRHGVDEIVNRDRLAKADRAHANVAGAHEAGVGDPGYSHDLRRRLADDRGGDSAQRHVRHVKTIAQIRAGDRDRITAGIGADSRGHHVKQAGRIVRVRVADNDRRVRLENEIALPPPARAALDADPVRALAEDCRLDSAEQDVRNVAEIAVEDRDGVAADARAAERIH